MKLGAFIIYIFSVRSCFRKGNIFQTNTKKNTSGVLESMTLQIEDFIPPDHTRANYAGLVLHGAHR